MKLVTEGTLTNSWCADKCSTNNYRYSATSAGNKCKCGHSYWTDARAEDVHSCRAQCLGNSSTICGGTDHNTIYESLYLDKCSDRIEEKYWDTLDQNYLTGINPACCKF